MSETEIEALRAVVQKYLPGAAGPGLWALTCIYTLTPDENFIVDRHPELPTVAIGCGFSGHGFKFTPVIGEALADLATGDARQSGVKFFSASRFNVAKRDNARLTRRTPPRMPGANKGRDVLPVLA